jgi:hypothetical protein
VCQSNMRQVGIGVLTYADEHNGWLPESNFIASRLSSSMKMPQQMITVRIDDSAARTIGLEAGWDGLGHLFTGDYLQAPQIFYCPSHRGDHRFNNYANTWMESSGEIVVNYHFRGEGPMGVDANDQPVAFTRNLFQIDPSQTSLIADGMRVRSDFNHLVGANYFRADLSVHWFSDPGRVLLNTLPVTEDAATAFNVANAWDSYDKSGKDPVTGDAARP